MSLQLEAFQGPSVACKGSKKLFSRKHPKGSKVKGAICFFTDSEDMEKKCPISPIFLTPIFN
uniref:Uncharacterized protein n=1 Tax=Saimiri boliviensis boliviensis TaxID=39432 RepID=A0A2K6V699_SAIBB